MKTNKMKTNRMKTNLMRITILLSALTLALILRLAYIQLLGHEELSAATRAQSLISLEGSNTRGMIYDRNGAALVADDVRFVYIIKEDALDSSCWKLLEKTDATEITGGNEGYHVFSSQHYDRNTGKKLIDSYDAYILQASARYSDQQLAAHLIGYVNRQDSSGAAGLELMYDEQLSGLDRKIYAVADVKGNILPGRGLIITSDAEHDTYIKDGIRTTIDKEMQAAVEEILEDSGGTCAAVVLDSKSGGVAAMACTPGFDPNKIDAYLESTGDELINKATQGKYAPGSLFKIIVAAAAMEHGVREDRSLTCSGTVQSGSLTIGCETGGETGHGAIGFADAFAQSCNSYFIQLGQELGADAVIDMAEAFGLGEKVLDGFPQESSGHLMTEGERAGDAIGNLCIGQGETLVTPLQMAAMTNIVAQDGIDKGVHLLMEEEPGSEQVISQRTASALQSMMEKVSREGTGRNMGLTEDDGRVRAAIKTGTAEYGAAEENKSHAWISGYAPCTEPEYTITVLVEGGTSGAGSAGPIFEKIVEYLEESGSYSRPVLA